MKKSKCLIISFWLGNRRKKVDEYEKDRLFFLKKQLESLKKYKNNLDKIILNFNVVMEHYSYFSEIFSIVPKKIKDVEVEINIRENSGISYGAFSDIFGKYKKEYDYYIFSEDDYIFVQDNWDEYLVDKYNSYSDCGYFCVLSREPARWFQYKKHAGNSIGISSSDNLLKVYNYSGQKLPHPESDEKYSGKDNINKRYLNYERGQIDFTFNFLKVGLNIYDIRHEYRAVVDAPNMKNADVCYYFNENKKDLVLPIKIIDKPFTWFASNDIEFRDDYEQLSVEKSLFCYENKLHYDEYLNNCIKKVRSSHDGEF